MCYRENRASNHQASSAYSSAARAVRGPVQRGNAVSLLGSSPQSDMWDQILQQIQAPEASKTSTAQSAVDCAQSPAASQGTMVGPSTDELESLNELIKFDHIYYKSPSPVKEDEDDTPIEEDDTPIDVDMIENNSIELLTDDALAQLRDIEALMHEDILTNTGDIVDISKDITYDSQSVAHKNNMATRKRKASVLDTPDVIDSITDLWSTVENDKLSTIDLDYSAKLSASESGYTTSDYGDAASPLSDTSSVLNDDNMWAESLTELFPGLA